MIKGIIFDFNGTLAYKTKSADAIPIAKFLQEKGIDIYHQELAASWFYVFFIEYPKGNIQTHHDFVSREFEILGIDYDKELVDSLSEFIRENNIYEFYPDVESVRKLKMKKGILTTIPQWTYDNLDLTEFDPIFSGKEIGRAKPHPDGFLKILKIWDLPPHDVLMVGDREDVDIIPAKQLGIKTAFLGRTGEKGEEADFNITSLEEVGGIVADEMDLLYSLEIGG